MGSPIDRKRLFAKIVAFEPEYAGNFLCHNLLANGKLLFESLMDLYINNKIQLLSLFEDKKGCDVAAKFTETASIYADFLHKEEVNSPDNFVDFALHNCCRETLEVIFDEERCSVSPIVGFG